MLYFRVSGRILPGVVVTLIPGIACKHNGQDCVDACFHGRIIPICDHVVHLIRSRRDVHLTRTWSAEGQELKLAKISRRSVVASAFGVNMMGRSVARGPLGGISVLLAAACAQ
jgi:hypothetical protein